jgi:hypothetical protein
MQKACARLVALLKRKELGPKPILVVQRLGMDQNVSSCLMYCTRVVTQNPMPPHPVEVTPWLGLLITERHVPVNI